MALSALSLVNNLGVTGTRFTTLLAGVSTGTIVRVIAGNARIGSDGLVIDNLPQGVINITAREVALDGSGFRDTDLVVYGAAALDQTSTLISALAKGQTDAQQRAAIAAGASVFAGLQSVGLAIGGTSSAPTPPSPSFSVAPSISPGSGTAGTTTFTATDGTVLNGSVTGRRWLLNSAAIGTGATVSPQASGSLILENTATGTNGSTITANSSAVIVSAAASGVVTPPAAFSAAYAQTGVGPAPAAIPVTITRAGSGTASTFTTNYDPESKRPAITNTYYVDPAVGDAGKNNDGLTAGTAVPSISIAQRLANAAAVPSRILVVPGTYLSSTTYTRTVAPTGTFPQSLAGQETTNGAIIIEPTTTNGRIRNIQVQVMPNAFSATTDANIYKSAYTASQAPQSAYDLANMDDIGIPRRLAPLIAAPADPTNPVAEMNALWTQYSACKDHPGDAASYALGVAYNDTTNKVFWVRLFNNRAPDSNFGLTNATSTSFVGNIATATKAITYWLRNIDFWGGTGFRARSASNGAYNVNVYTSGCTFAFGTYAGSFAFENGGGEVINYNIGAGYSDQDDLNYHGPNGTTDPSLCARVTEINPKTRWSGWNTAGTNNGSTIHEFCRIVRVNFSFLHAQDRPHHDVYGAMSWSMGGEASTRHGADGSEAGGVYASGQTAGTGASASIGSMWLDACKIVPNFAGVAPPFTLQSYQQSTMYHANDTMTVSPNNPGTGTITSYVP